MHHKRQFALYVHPGERRPVVGLEDSLWLGRGTLAESNAAQVLQARQIIEGLGLEIASPNEAREILQLKGIGKVKF